LLDDGVAPQYQAAGLLDNWTVQASPISLAAYVEKLASLPLRAQPGTAWCDSAAMNVLGRVVEVVTKERFGAFVKRRILDPLQMNDTDFYVHGENRGRLIEVYEAGSQGRLLPCSARLGFNHPPSADLGGSGFVGTAADYLRLARMLLNGGVLEGVRRLEPEMVKRIATDHLGPEFGDRPFAGDAGWTVGGTGGGARLLWRCGQGSEGTRHCRFSGRIFLGRCCQHQFLDRF
jgi:CubicO group peptidase (beta-lactamase class C family)